jgi:hypothetical protein
MRVQRVVMPSSGAESWTLLGDDGGPVEPAERFLAYLRSVERSPNTVRSYAHDLKDWFGRFGLDWVPRPDGMGYSINGIGADLMDVFSHRRNVINEKVADELVPRFQAEYGRSPNQRGWPGAR